MLRICALTLLCIALVNCECNAPPDIENASHNATGAPPYPEGVVAQYSCNSGYGSVGGSNKFTCTQGSWTGGDITCEKRCGRISIPRNGYLSETPDYSVGSLARFACNEGYRLVGSETMRCRFDGHWFPADSPTCEVVSCGEFGPVQNGNFHQNMAHGKMNSYQSVVTVTCNLNFVLVGSPQSVCGADGAWGPKPTCERTSCPSYPTQSSCVDTTTLSHDVYVLTCKEGDNVSVTKVGPATDDCFDGQWEHGNMACYCDCKVTVDSRYVVVNNVNSKGFLPHGESLSWSCKNNAKKQQLSTLSCSDGEMEMPVCIPPVTTPSLPPQTSSGEDVTTGAPPEEDNALIYIIIVVICSLVLLGGIIAGFLFWKKKKLNNSASNESKEMKPLQNNVSEDHEKALAGSENC